MESDDDADPEDVKYIVSQKAGLQTSSRIYAERKKEIAAGHRRKTALPVLDGAGKPLTLVGKAHWAETTDMPYLEKMRMRSLPASYTRESVSGAYGAASTQ